jgi:hypothetical protein
MVIATGGWPVGLPDNPYNGLADVAELTTVAQVFVALTMPKQSTSPSSISVTGAEMWRRY